VAAGDLLFADGDKAYDLIVMLAGTADIIEGHGHSEEIVVAGYGPSEFLGETGIRAQPFASSSGHPLTSPP